jgi:fructose transport system substrate-binding protein
MKKLLATTAVVVMALTGAASAQGVTACLITKTDTNPFFVKMKEGAEAEAAVR